MMNFLVIGTGAVGSFYGSLLAKAGHDVSVVARSDYDHIKQHGIHVRSDRLNNQWHFTPRAVYRAAAEANPKPDYILLCTKILPGLDQWSLVKDALGENTSVVLVANGIDIERDLAAHLPPEKLLSVMTYITVTRTAAGEIWHQGQGDVVMGAYPSGIPASAQKLAPILEQAGIGVTLTDDIEKQRWKKTVWNAAFNTLCVAMGGLTVRQVLEKDEAEARAVMHEICAIAAARGRPLPDDHVDALIKFSWGMPPYKPSMLVDFEAGRPMEIEPILGAPLRLAQEENLATPRIAVLYQKLQSLQVKS